MLIREVEIDGQAPLDVRLQEGRVQEIARSLEPGTGESVFPARGGVLLPGLHDHHIHLMALAARRTSLPCGPPEVRDSAALARQLEQARPDPRSGWIRGVGYHDSVAGPLDRWTLDAWVPEHRLRIQHRSGALWILNSAGLEALGIDAADCVLPPGAQRDARGLPDGRLLRCDDWLRAQSTEQEPPDLRPVGQQLAAFGVTGVTDATPHNGAEELSMLSRASQEGALPQRLCVMGRRDLPCSGNPRVERGALKLWISEHELPDLRDLLREIEGAHEADRPVAIHCVTRSELVLAASALATAGGHPRDRIEHAAITPPDLMEQLARIPVTVVTQPNFLWERGDRYAREVDPGDLPWLYRCRGFEEAGVSLAGGTDAPFGNPDPWRAMQAAVERCSEGGLCLGGEERLRPEEALALFTRPLEDPGAAPRRVEPGAPADLCLLDRPWTRARDSLEADCVAATFCDGKLVWRAR
ncbi:MAG: amidohydrolase family protein [Myxococcales bacterium]|nr:amidohydrolase family protein [Myxococcales bacterium]